MSPELLAATQGANQIQAPVSNLGASQGAELANMYQSSFQLPQSQGAVGAQANIAAEQVAAAKKAAAEAEQRQQDLANPDKYRKVPSKDGGYDFFAPDGSQIDIATLTQKTGTKADYWLKDSQDPTDIQYLEDSKNLQNFVNAALTKDKNTYQGYIDSAKANGIDLNPYIKNKGGVHNLIQKFQQTYQRYYVPQSKDPQAWGRVPGNPVVPASQGSSTTPTPIGQ